MWAVTLCDDLALCFLFWFGFVLLLFILTGCCCGLMVLDVGDLEGHS
jgi:hypothetical protein